MSLNDPFSFSSLALRLNRDFDIGYHHFAADVPRLLDLAFDNSLYSVRRHFDLDETDDAFILTLELPGFKQADVEVALDKAVLTVTAKRGERSYQQSVTVPDGVDADRIEAKLEDGVLVLTLSKLPITKPRRVEVK